MSEISLTGWKIIGLEIMVQKSLNTMGLPFLKKNIPGSVWQYLQISEALTAAIQIHRSEFT